jgi:dynein light chain 1
MPPMDKMDESLNQFEKCEKLSLSSNQIERMITLPKLKSLRILSLGRNNIKRIMALEEIGLTLEELWLSYNQIEKLDGLGPCIKLTNLFMSNNRIKSWEEVAKLS